MPKVKIPRKTTHVDMTAMCDVAFLLLTFFMLTSNFVAKEPVLVSVPSSISEIKIPETKIMTILVDNKGKIFFGVDKQDDRIEMLKTMGEAYKVQFTDAELRTFSLINSTGVPMEQMKLYLSLPSDERDRVENMSGIPIDSLNNQFKSWVQSARKINRDFRIAIKADAVTTYPKIREVMKSLQEIDENRYNLITSLENAPEGL